MVPINAPIPIQVGICWTLFEPLATTAKTGLPNSDRLHVTSSAQRPPNLFPNHLHQFWVPDLQLC